MTRLVSTRYGISYGDPALRDEPADVPADIALLVAAIEGSAMYAQGTDGARPAAGKPGRFYYATNITTLYWDTGATWITIGPPAADSITAVQIAANAVGASELADNAVDTNAIVNDAVTAAKIAADAVGTSEIAAGAVGASELADNSVDTAAIQDNAVTSAKIAADQVTATHIAADAVGTSEIAPNAVGTSELADNAVDTAAIQPGAVTHAKMAPIAGITLARRNSVQPISAGGWTDVIWDTQSATEGVAGTTFWNGSNAIDLLVTGWHSIIASIAFDTAGSVGIRLLNSSTGAVVGGNGPWSSAGLNPMANLAIREFLPSTEYILQVYNSNGGLLSLFGEMPLLTARVEH